MADLPVAVSRNPLAVLLKHGARIVKNQSGYKPPSPNPGTVSNGCCLPGADTDRQAGLG